MENYNYFAKKEMSNGNVALLYSENINTYRVDGFLYSNTIEYPKEKSSKLFIPEVKGNDIKISIEIFYKNTVQSFSLKDSFTSVEMAKKQVFDTIKELAELNYYFHDESAEKLLELGFKAIDSNPYSSLIKDTQNEILSNNYFLSRVHLEKFKQMGTELNITLNKDVYWRSIVYLIAGNEQLFSVRNELIDYEKKLIRSDYWFNGLLSGGEQRLLKLGYNLFTNLDYYKDEEDVITYISPLDIFNGLDSENYKLAMNTINMRLEM